MIYYDLASKKDIIDEHYQLLKPKLETNIANSRLNSTCINFIENNLEAIITSEPKTLVWLNNKFKSLLSFRATSKIQKNRIKKIFDYDWFTTKRKTVYDAYDLAKKLDVRTCLYCNRMYTITVQEGILDEEKITRPQFDHFLDKDANPLLALSIYNLVPSCNICNSTLKGTDKFNTNSHVHPYIHNFITEYWYRYIPYDVESILGNKSNLKVGIDIANKVTPNERRRLRRTINTFQLNAIFSGHSEELKDLFDIRHRFSERYFIELFKTYGSLKLSEEEVYRIVFGVEYKEDDFYKRPFSKIKKDLLKELGVIKR